MASPPTTLDGRVQAALAGSFNIQLSSAEVTAALGQASTKAQQADAALGIARSSLINAQAVYNDNINKLKRENKYTPAAEEFYGQNVRAKEGEVARAQAEVNNSNQIKNTLNNLRSQAERREAVVAASKAAEDAKRQAELKPPPAKVAAVIKDQSKGLPISEEAKLTERKVKSKLRKPLPKLKKRRR